MTVRVCLGISGSVALVFHVVLDKGIGTVTYVMSVLAADEAEPARLFAGFGKRNRDTDD